MGTESTKKLIKQVSGTLTEEAALTTSAGAGDANRIPALNVSGVLDPSITNAKNTSTGAADAGKLAMLDSAGKLDTSMMPTGIGADVSIVVASEALAAGDFVNIWNDSGTANARKADASTSGKHAHGFTLSAVASGNNATIYFEGTNNQCTGLTIGDQFLSASTPGKPTSTAPSTAGNTVQFLGVATSDTSMNVELARPIVLA